MKVFKKAATILAALSLALGMFSIKIDAQAEAKTWYIRYDDGTFSFLGDLHGTERLYRLYPRQSWQPTSWS